jgi:three-Cys-motif partner protein
MKHTFGGPWTQIKLDLLGRYLSSFNQALQFSPSANRPFSRIYIDAFAGTGECEIKTDENAVETIAGSAKIALETTPLSTRYTSSISTVHTSTNLPSSPRA